MGKKNMTESRYNKDDLLKVEITDIGNDGEGIGKIDGYTLFIKDAVIGDTVSAKIMKAKKNYAYAHLEEVIRPSEFRQTPRCEIARQCGGCQLQNMTYERQLEFKQNKVRNNIVRLGGFDGEFIDGIMQPIIGMEEPWRYRNKAQYPIGKDREGRPVAGYYAGRTHSIIPVNDCYIGIEENKEILDIVIKHMEKHGIKPYDENSGKGIVRHVLIRKGFATGQIMVCIVINCAGKEAEYLPGQKCLVSELEKINGMTSVSVNINAERTNVIMGRETHTIWGRDVITDTLCGLDFEISPLSFYQVNPHQAQKLYEQAIEYAGLTGTETVWDLYCGIGTITLSMARRAGRVYGVEVVPDAIEDAKANAARNGIDNADFFCGKAEEVLPEFYEKNQSINEESQAIHPDVIVVDPPRKGCDSACLETMLRMKPDRIVYVSCDSATLSRDLRILADGGYELKAVRPCDMFSWTGHVETVVLLSKGDINSRKVRVEFSLEDMDTSGFQQGATYDAIRDWVMEKYGFRVSNLSIAQVKQKHGIIERENYNKPKSPESKQPGTSEMRIKAIENALRYFQMI